MRKKRIRFESFTQAWWANRGKIFCYGKLLVLKYDPLQAFPGQEQTVVGIKLCMRDFAIVMTICYLLCFLSSFCSSSCVTAAFDSIALTSKHALGCSFVNFSNDDMSAVKPNSVQDEKCWLSTQNLSSISSVTSVVILVAWGCLICKITVWQYWSYWQKRRELMRG